LSAGGAPSNVVLDVAARDGERCYGPATGFGGPLGVLCNIVPICLVFCDRANESGLLPVAARGDFEGPARLAGLGRDIRFREPLRHLGSGIGKPMENRDRADVCVAPRDAPARARTWSEASPNMARK
jgi:hypothetical protein